MNLDAHTLDVISRLAVALGIGLLVGIERGWQEREEPEGGRTAGIRTYTLIALLGGVSAVLLPVAGPWPLTGVLLSLSAAFTWFKHRESIKANDYSVTGVVAALITFVLGAVAIAGSIQVAVSAGIAMTLLLAARTSLHTWLRKLTWPELRSGLLLVAMTFLALPLLPNRPIDPWGAINPHQLWLLTIMIAAISGAGYAAVKIAGPKRGVLFGALATGLVSSTSATLTSARRVQQGGSPGLLATGAAIASAMSFLRTLVIALIIVPEIAVYLAAAFVPAMAVVAVMALLFWRGAELEKENAASLAGSLGNPIDIAFVLRFGALLAAVLAITKLAAHAFGASSFVGLAAATGIVDVDPITLSAPSVAMAGAPATAAIGVLVAAVSNMTSKSVIAFAVGGRAYGTRYLLMGLAALAAGAVGLIAAVFVYKPF